MVDRRLCLEEKLDNFFFNYFYNNSIVTKWRRGDFFNKFLQQVRECGFELWFSS